MSSLCSFESSFKDLSFKRARFRSLKKSCYGNQKNLSWKTEIWLSRHERVKVLYVHFILMVWVWFPTTARQAICQQTSTPYPEELMRMLMIYRIQKQNSGHKLSRIEENYQFRVKKRVFEIMYDFARKNFAFFCFEIFQCTKFRKLGSKTLKTRKFLPLK